MAGSQRKPRKKATAALSALHERICAGGAHADCVTDVYAFGSYARGALTVGDVDVDTIEYDGKLRPAVERKLRRRTGLTVCSARSDSAMGAVGGRPAAASVGR